MKIIVSTSKFWELMQSARFRRISEKKGIMLDNEYYCSNPPDDEFFNSIIEDIRKDLK